MIRENCLGMKSLVEGTALEYVHADNYGEPDHTQNPDEHAFLSERRGTEYSGVQQQKRNFDKVYGKTVGDNCGHQKLQRFNMRRSVVRRWNGVYLQEMSDLRFRKCCEG